MKEEVIKAYRIPIETPKDLVEAYFRIKEKALDEIISHVKYSNSGKAHLYFKAEERRELRNELLRDWRYSKNYVDSAINSIISLVK